MKLAKLLILFNLLLVNSINYAQSNLQIEKEIDSFLNDLNEKEFSGTILVANKNSIIQKRAYGLASKEWNIKNKVDTKFNIASITKTFTAVAILQLYEQGKIDLHTPIGKYLKDYPNEEVKNAVTISHLLTHTSGLSNFYVTNFVEKCKFQFKEVKDFIPLFVNDTLLATPGTKYNYDAAGYVLMGLIIEEISGKDYYEYLKENIFNKAGMPNTAAYTIDAIIEKKANGYTFETDTTKTIVNNIFYLSKASPGGFHYSTVEDLYHFNKALFSNKLLKKETLALMIEPKVKGYNTHVGYGIDIDNRYGQPILGHTGGWYGISGEVIYLPKSEYTITILSNEDTAIDAGTSMVSTFFKILLAGNIKK